MKNRRFDLATLYTMGIFVLFLAGFLLLVLFGAGTYGETVESQRENNNRRALLSYISVNVRNHDHTGVASVEAGPEGDVLVLSGDFGSASYVTRIYLSEGELVEEYGKAEKDLGSGEVRSIGACTDFTVEAVSSQCLRVWVNGDSVLLHLRSESEGSI